MSLEGKRIGVMMGGLSAERDISYKSGQAVFSALKRSGLDVVALEIARDTEEEIRSAVVNSAVDIVFIAMHGGFGEDGRLQHILEKMNVCYTGSRARCSRMAMDKTISCRLFQKAGLRVPKHRQWRRGAIRFFADLFLRYPLVVKPSAQGSSIGISFVDSSKSLSEALGLALKFSDEGEEVLIEEFIKGREITVSVLDGNALPVVEIIPKKQFFDFEAKYQKGMAEYVVPAPLDDATARKVKADALTAYRVLGCRHLSRVDMIISEDGRVYVLEVNTIPGMTETSLLPKAAQAAGIGFDQLCLKIVEMAAVSENI
ncbi:MAG: D-alanine--D-alanine ligase [Candidatus Omnitrophota bacterium]